MTAPAVIRFTGPAGVTGTRGRASGLASAMGVGKRPRLHPLPDQERTDDDA